MSTRSRLSSHPTAKSVSDRAAVKGEQSPPRSSIPNAPRTTIHLSLITLADFIVRAAYMTGKTPLLPVFAATLGAGEIYLGIISSISAITGMVLKPIIGLLSDRQGRRWWLFLGAIFFVTIPFFYRFIQTPEQLMGIRLVHGLATAIYGPVTVAMVVEMSPKNRAGRVGFFSLGRSGGYIVGPALGGYFLYQLENPAQAYTIVGFMSMAALIPLLYLPETVPVQSLPNKETRRVPILQQLQSSIREVAITPAIWIASGFEAMNYMVTYAAKAFLPIYALAVGRNALEAGLFFTVQQAVALLAKPVCGWLSDRGSTYITTIVVALVVMALSLVMLTFSANMFIFFAAAILLGLAEAMIVPSATALVARQIDAFHLGAGLGFVGTLRNASKVFGPIGAGFLISVTGYEAAFRIMAATILGVGIVLLIGRQRKMLL